MTYGPKFENLRDSPSLVHTTFLVAPKTYVQRDGLLPLTQTKFHEAYPSHQRKQCHPYWVLCASSQISDPSSCMAIAMTILCSEGLCSNMLKQVKTHMMKHRGFSSLAIYPTHCSIFHHYPSHMLKKVKICDETTNLKLQFSGKAKAIQHAYAMNWSNGHEAVTRCSLSACVSALKLW